MAYCSFAKFLGAVNILPTWLLNVHWMVRGRGGGGGGRGFKELDVSIFLRLCGSLIATSLLASYGKSRIIQESEISRGH